MKNTKKKKKGKKRRKQNEEETKATKKKESKTQRRRKKGNAVGEEWTGNTATHDTCKQFKKKKDACNNTWSNQQVWKCDTKMPKKPIN